MTATRPAPDPREWLAVVGTWLAGALLFFRDTVASGFDHLSGDRYDTRLITLLHEHWLEVLRGNQSWRSPNFFHPVKGALGYSDTFLLDEVLYAPLRLLGLDRYLATQWTIILLGLIGFVGTYLVAVRLIGTSRLLGLGVAYVVTFANCMAVQITHTQLCSVAWVPWLILAAARAVKAPTRRASQSWAATTGVLAGTLVLSTYYIGWFTCFAAAVFGAILAVVMRRRLRAAGPRRVLQRTWRPLVACAAGFAVLLVPFTLIYLPVLRDTGARPFLFVLGLTPGVVDVVNVGGRNAVWGPVLRVAYRHSARLNVVEMSSAVTPLIFLAVLVSGVLVARRRRGDGSLRHAIALSLVVLTFVLTLLPVHANIYSPWRLVWAVVPGARGLRAVGRLQVLVALIAPLAIAASLVALGVGRAGVRAGRRGTALLTAGVLLLALEQFNLRDTTGIDRSDELALIADIPAPPTSCRSFFILPVADRRGDELQVDAMVIAQTTGLPTINGYSGSFPTGWNLLQPTTWYLDAARYWIDLHHLTDVCGYDGTRRSWLTSPFDTLVGG